MAAPASCKGAGILTLNRGKRTGTYPVNEESEQALHLMAETGEEHIAIVDSNKKMEYKGCIHQRDVMAAYNRALVDNRHEERGDAI